MTLPKLRRIVASESWIPEIDGLRFVAILAVLIFHALGEVLHRGEQPWALRVTWWFSRVLFNGDRGVDLFFVISGLVLARPFYAQFRRGGPAVRLKGYLLRRLTRLEPPYLLSLALYAMGLGAIYTFSRRFLLLHLLTSVFYLNNVVYPGQPIFPNFVTWSLEVEVQFYLLAPLLGQIFRIERRGQRRGVLLALTVAGCMASLRLQSPTTCLSFAGYLPAGFLLADLFEDPVPGIPDGVGWDVAGVLGWAVVFLLTPGSVFVRCVLPVVIVPLFYSVFHGPAQRWLFRRTLLTTLGGMCYSLYLMHEAAISLSFHAIRHVRVAGDGMTILAQTALMLIAILLVGGGFFLLIERPTMRRRWPQELVALLRSRAALQDPDLR